MTHISDKVKAFSQLSLSLSLSFFNGQTTLLLLSWSKKFKTGFTNLKDFLENCFIQITYGQFKRSFKMYSSPTFDLKLNFKCKFSLLKRNCGEKKFKLLFFLKKNAFLLCSRVPKILMHLLNYERKWKIVFQKTQIWRKGFVISLIETTAEQTFSIITICIFNFKPVVNVKLKHVNVINFMRMSWTQMCLLWNSIISRFNWSNIYYFFIN